MVNIKLNDWGVTLDDYLKGGWGTAVNDFRVPASYIKRFTKDMVRTSTLALDYNDTDFTLTTDADQSTWDVNSNMLVNGNLWTFSPNGWTDNGAYSINKVFDKVKGFEEVATTYVNAIIAQFDILKQAKFEYLLPDTQDNLKKAVYNAVEYSALNRQFWENANGSSISTPGFSINADQTGWMLTSDMMGTKAWNYLTNAELVEYDIIGDFELSQLVYNDSQGKIVLHEYNNTELGKLLSDRQGKTITDEIAHVTSADKYDYVVVDGSISKEIWRFEGGDFTDVANWDRKDIKTIEGKRYLVFKNYVLTGSEGRDGKDLDVSGLTPDQIIGGVTGTLENGLVGRGITSEHYDSNTGILTITFSDNTTYSTTDLRGLQGIQGPSGHSFTPKGSKTNEAEIKAIVNPIDDEAWVALDTEQLWVYSSTANPAAWINMGSVVGPQGLQGIQGVPGPASTVPGPIGKTGPQGASAVWDKQITLHFSDGTSETFGVGGIPHAK